MSKSKPRCGEKIEPIHKPGAASSLDEPVGGAQPSKVNCPICSKSFPTHSEMERHRENMHKKLEGHGR